MDDALLASGLVLFLVIVLHAWRVVSPTTRELLAAAAPSQQG
jgi:hypothetical protein